ncbi:MAG: hypothetical protein KGD64_03885 [Candidatus Heimdallarchaeota archaeon]|nr:hypothetical protein [Candidatus Heimdallarchaeota archaeon]
MKTKTRIISVISFIVLLSLLNLNPTLGTTSERDWLEGDIEVYGFRMHVGTNYANLLTNLTGSEIMEAEMDYQLELIDVNQVTYDYVFNATMPYGSLGESDSTGDIDYIIDDMMDYFLHFEYVWDDSANITRLIDFNVGNEYLVFFIEPDWDKFNQALADIFDRERLIASIAHDSTTTNITMGDFLDSLTSYQLLGVEGFSESEEIDPVTKWTLTFDLNQSIYDKSTPLPFVDTFTLYNKYNASCVLEYTEGGTLVESESSIRSGIINVDEEEGDLYFEQYSYQQLIRGGLNPEKASVNLYSILSAILVVPIIIYIYIRRKR